MPTPKHRWEANDNRIADRVIRDLVTNRIPFEVSFVTKGDLSPLVIVVDKSHAYALQELVNIKTYKVKIDAADASGALIGTVRDVFSCCDDSVRQLIMEQYPTHHGNRIIDADVDEDNITLYFEVADDPSPVLSRKTIRKVG